jgi:hypothetical protein
MVMITQSAKYTKTHWIVHFKRVNFIVYKLYPIRAVKYDCVCV